jgi:hypothetical protein
MVRCCTTTGVARWGKEGFQDRREVELEIVMLVEGLVQGMWDKWTAESSRWTTECQAAPDLGTLKRVVE